INHCICFFCQRFLIHKHKLTMKYKMTDEDFKNSILDLIILTQAKQEALINLVIDNLVEKSGDEKTIVKEFDEDFLAAETRIRDLLYEHYGATDIDEILGQDDDDKQ
ncbi:MAG TPA: hypothetical protein VN451_10425, partial [Chitinophagaceae bacterium]|nr:hypothetical protein [Chitinophagaceae bacterium]